MRIHYIFAILFVAHLAFAGLWDLACIFWFRSDTLSETIRETWLRYPMVVLATGFGMMHFWVRR